MEKIKFLRSVNDLNHLPDLKLPEIVLCGRSNVGKSSFINSFFNRKGIAKTSSTPGKTRSLNYYLVDEKLYIVDLPGYGYSKISKSERNRWQELIENYFSTSEKIELACHFIDSRYNPTSLDMLLHNYLKEIELNYIVILTKVDKLKQSELAKAKREINKTLPELILGKNLFLYSATKGIGKKDLQKKFNKLL